MKNNRKLMATRTLTLAAILTAIVFVLQCFCVIKAGVFSISMVLVPIVIGAATCGYGVSMWLGLVFGIAVLLSGDAAPFLAISIPGTVITVISKGIFCGLAAAVTYKAVKKISNDYVAVMAAAIICPIVNTGVFFIGCAVFFMDYIKGLALNAHWSGNIFGFMIMAFVGLNFLIEMCVNIVLSPVIVRLLKIKK